MWFPSIFSQYVACLFTLKLVPFTEQKVLILMKSNWSIFILWIIFLVSCLRTLCQTKDHRYFLLCFLLKVLSFYIYICVPVWVHFCTNVKFRSRFAFCFVLFFAFGWPIVSIPFVQDCPFSIELPLHIYRKTILPYLLWVNFWTLYFVLFTYTSISYANTTLSWLL